MLAGRGRRDPAARPVRGGDPSVQGRGGLERHPGPSATHRGEPGAQQLLHLVGSHALLRPATPAARSAAAPPPATGDGSATACTTRPTPASISAAVHGSGAARVVAGLERDDHRAAQQVGARRAGRGDRRDLGVRRARALVPALAEGAPVGGQQRRRRRAGWGRGRGRGARAPRRAPSRRVRCRGAPSTSSRALRLRGMAAGARTPCQRAPTDPRHDATCFLPSGLSPSVLEFHQVNRPARAEPCRPGRGLSPPARNCTDPGARTCSPPVCHTAPGTAGTDVRAATGRRGPGQCRCRCAAARSSAIRADASCAP